MIRKISYITIYFEILLLLSYSCYARTKPAARSLVPSSAVIASPTHTNQLGSMSLIENFPNPLWEDFRPAVLFKENEVGIEQPKSQFVNILLNEADSEEGPDQFIPYKQSLLPNKADNLIIPYGSRPEVHGDPELGKSGSTVTNGPVSKSILFSKSVSSLIKTPDLEPATESSLYSTNDSVHNPNQSPAVSKKSAAYTNLPVMSPRATHIGGSSYGQVSSTSGGYGSRHGRPSPSAGYESTNAGASHGASRTSGSYGPSNHRSSPSPGSYGGGGSHRQKPPQPRTSYGSQNTASSHGHSSGSGGYGSANTGSSYRPSTSPVVYGTQNTGPSHGPSTSSAGYGSSNTGSNHGHSPGNGFSRPSNSGASHGHPTGSRNGYSASNSGSNHVSSTSNLVFGSKGSSSRHGSSTSNAGYGSSNTVSNHGQSAGNGGYGTFSGGSGHGSSSSSGGYGSQSNSGSGQGFLSGKPIGLGSLSLGKGSPGSIDHGVGPGSLNIDGGSYSKPPHTPKVSDTSSYGTGSEVVSSNLDSQNVLYLLIPEEQLNQIFGSLASSSSAAAGHLMHPFGSFIPKINDFSTNYDAFYEQSSETIMGFGNMRENVGKFGSREPIQHGTTATPNIQEYGREPHHQRAMMDLDQWNNAHPMISSYPYSNLPAFGPPLPSSLFTQAPYASSNNQQNTPHPYGNQLIQQWPQYDKSQQNNGFQVYDDKFDNPVYQEYGRVSAPQSSPFYLNSPPSNQNFNELSPFDKQWQAFINNIPGQQTSSQPYTDYESERLVMLISVPQDPTHKNQYDNGNKAPSPSNLIISTPAHINGINTNPDYNGFPITDESHGTGFNLPQKLNSEPYLDSDYVSNHKDAVSDYSWSPSPIILQNSRAPAQGSNRGYESLPSSPYNNGPLNIQPSADYSSGPPAPIFNNLPSNFNYNTMPISPSYGESSSIPPYSYTGAGYYDGVQSVYNAEPPSNNANKIKLITKRPQNPSHNTGNLNQDYSTNQGAIRAGQVYDSTTHNYSSNANDSRFESQGYNKLPSTLDSYKTTLPPRGLGPAAQNPNLIEPTPGYDNSPSSIRDYKDSFETPYHAGPTDSNFPSSKSGPSHDYNSNPSTTINYINYTNSTGNSAPSASAPSSSAPSSSVLSPSAPISIISSPSTLTGSAQNPSPPNASAQNTTAKNGSASYPNASHPSSPSPSVSNYNTGQNIDINFIDDIGPYSPDPAYNDHTHTSHSNSSGASRSGTNISELSAPEPSNNTVPTSPESKSSIPSSTHKKASNTSNSSINGSSYNSNRITAEQNTQPEATTVLPVLSTNTLPVPEPEPIRYVDDNMSNVDDQAYSTMNPDAASYSHITTPSFSQEANEGYNMEFINWNPVDEGPVLPNHANNLASIQEKLPESEQKKQNYSSSTIKESVGIPTNKIDNLYAIPSLNTPPEPYQPDPYGAILPYEPTKVIDDATAIQSYGLLDLEDPDPTDIELEKIDITDIELLKSLSNPDISAKLLSETPIAIQHNPIDVSAVGSSEYLDGIGFYEADYGPVLLGSVPNEADTFLGHSFPETGPLKENQPNELIQEKQKPQPPSAIPDKEFLEKSSNLLNNKELRHNLLLLKDADNTAPLEDFTPTAKTNNDQLSNDYGQEISLYDAEDVKLHSYGGTLIPTIDQPTNDVWEHIHDPDEHHHQELVSVEQASFPESNSLPPDVIAEDYLSNAGNLRSLKEPLNKPTPPFSNTAYHKKRSYQRRYGSILPPSSGLHTQGGLLLPPISIASIKRQAARKGHDILPPVALSPFKGYKRRPRPFA